MLDRIERRLLDAGAKRAETQSKLGRLLAQEVPAHPSSPKPNSASSAADVLLAYLRAQAEQLRKYDPLVRRDVPDAVHRMRVAARIGSTAAGPHW
jgi:hypothetical protein